MSLPCTNLTLEDQAERDAIRRGAQLFLICVTPVLALLGIAANSVNIVVLTRKWMASSTNYYLTALAITDIVYLALVYLITVKVYPGVAQLSWYFHLLAAMFPLANLFSNFATWLTCFFTFERWVVVYKPMFGRKYCTKERAKHTIGAIFLATLVFTFPNFLEYRLNTVSQNVTLPDGSSQVATAYILDKTGAFFVAKRLGYYHLFPVLFTFGPLIFLAVFNSLLIGSVIRAKKKQEELSAALIPRRPSATPRPSQQFSQSPMLATPRGSVCSGVGGASSSTAGGPGSSSMAACGGGSKAFGSASARAARALGKQQQQTLHGGGNRKLRASTEQQKITVMLIAVVILFCLCQLPSAFYTLRKAITPAATGKQCPSGRYQPIVSTIVNLLLVVNAACNFILYSCFSTKFRKTFHKVFIVCGRRGNGDVTTMLHDYDRTPRCSEPNIHELQMQSSVKTCLLQVPSNAQVRRVSY